MEAVLFLYKTSFLYEGGKAYLRRFQACCKKDKFVAKNSVWTGMLQKPKIRCKNPLKFQISFYMTKICCKNVEQIL